MRRSPRLGRGLVAATAVIGAAIGVWPAVPAVADTTTVGTLRVTLDHGVLTIEGGRSRNAIVLARNDDRNLTLNNRPLIVAGAPVRVADLERIRMIGGEADDILRVSALIDAPAVELRGGPGNDILDGGAGPDLLDGGPGIDAIDGGPGSDEIIGGTGNDKIIGGEGDDVVDTGDGSDQITWTPGSGSDVIEGGSGTDTLVFDGSDGSDTVEFGAGVRHAILTRGAPGTDRDRLVLSGIENVKANLARGVDSTVIGELASTGIRLVQVTHATSNDSGSDTVTIVGTTHGDRLRVFGDRPPASAPAVVTVGGQLPTVQLSGAENLVLIGGAGDDILDAGRLAAGILALTASGGPDNDTLIGTTGNDRLFGDAGDDHIDGRTGEHDVLDGGPGNNVIVP